MKKDRFVAFFDAIMAIIMTIVVLEFVIPDGTKWSDLSTLGYQILAYATAFFWLGGLWINIHNLWHGVDIVDRGVLWTNIVMLFFVSMLPFFVVYAGRNLGEIVPQILYGADVIMITICNEISVELLARHHSCVKAQIPFLRISVSVDLGIKVIGFIIALTVFPMAIMISVIVSTLFLIVWRYITGWFFAAQG
ncbi:MAG TPA: hypothetical protein DIC18_03710 [Clostridiales bacterium]|nr:hypothetical protein [Clostridiales bacterium]HCU56421.1 hypothetical protein [Clostridiales bacterium]